MKTFVLKFTLLSAFIIASIGMACAQANHDINFRLYSQQSVTVTIQQPRLAVLTKNNSTATMDALFVTSDYEAIVDMKFQIGSNSSSQYYRITITADNKVVKTWNTHLEGYQYYGPIPLNKASDSTDVLITVEATSSPF